MDYRIILGLLSVIIGIVAYIAYFRNILAGKTKPHAFSWFVWGILTGIAFAIQFTEGAGPGSWALGITALVCFIIFFFALIKGQRDFPISDWLCLAGAIISLGMWLLAKNPTQAMIILIITDALAFIPTYRKGWEKPYEETATLFGLNSIKFILGILALNTITLTTAIYPAYLIVSNLLLVIILLMRRR